MTCLHNHNQILEFLRKIFLKGFQIYQNYLCALNVKLNNVAVECVNEAKCFGVTLDSHLTFNSHVNNIATLIKQKIGVLRRLRHHFDSRQLTSIYWGNVLPHILYCANVWSGRSNRNHDTLNKLHGGQRTWCPRKHGLHPPMRFSVTFRGHL